MGGLDDPFRDEGVHDAVEGLHVHRVGRRREGTAAAAQRVAMPPLTLDKPSELATDPHTHMPGNVATFAEHAEALVERKLNGRAPLRVGKSAARCALDVTGPTQQSALDAFSWSR